MSSFFIFLLKNKTDKLHIIYNQRYKYSADSKDAFFS
jgi:hypothetical protein